MNPVICQNSLYLIVNGPSWNEAQINAENLGGSLTRIDNQDEQNFLYSSFKDTGRSELSLQATNQITGSDFGLWIGATDRAAEGVWTDPSGVTLSYTNWFPGEPNNVGFYNPNGEDYAAMGFSSSPAWQGRGGQWADLGNFAINSDQAFTGIAEIPLSLAIKTLGTPKEGAGVFTTSIHLSAGTQASGNLAEGATVYWKVSGITTNDLASGSLTGSGVIANGKLDIQHSLVNDSDSGESFDVSVFSDAERTQQIGNSVSFQILEGKSDPITGILDLPRKVKLANHGKVPFRLYGSDEIDVNKINFDDLIFGKNLEVLMSELVPPESYFKAAQYKRGRKAGSCIAKIIDFNKDGYKDILIKANKRDLSRVMSKGDSSIYAFTDTGENSFLFSNTNAIFI